jgi:hypothetical protein
MTIELRDYKRYPRSFLSLTVESVARITVSMHMASIQLRIPASAATSLN